MSHIFFTLIARVAATARYPKRATLTVTYRASTGKYELWYHCGNRYGYIS
jgi:hypothetical protein